MNKFSKIAIVAGTLASVTSIAALALYKFKEKSSSTENIHNLDSNKSDAPVDPNFCDKYSDVASYTV